jgi:effector-binding domain-containing protein
MTATQLESMEVLVPEALVAQLEGLTSTQQDIGAVIRQGFATLYGAIGQAGIGPAGAPRAIYTAWGPNEIHFTAAVPVDRSPATTPDAGGVRIAHLPARVALRFVHRGPYRDISATYDRIDTWLRERGGISTPADWARYAPMWEEYMNDPATTPESDLETRIFLSLREE